MSENSMNKSSEQSKWVHLIGICGVTMAPLANMLQKMGWTVTGSDKGIFPPMSDYLKSRNITIELGYVQDHLTTKYYKRKRGNFFHTQYPDMVVVGNYIGMKNPEYQFAKSKGMDIKSYPDILKEYVIKSNSIVVAGTYGKTTCTGLLALIFQKAGKDPSFMIGGIAINFDNGIVNSAGNWSIVEGDEYISARFDPVSKFFHYKTEFLLLTAAGWEHTDIFITQDDYVKNFKNFVRTIPKHGLIVAKRKGENISQVIKEASCKVITYELRQQKSSSVQADWYNVVEKQNEAEIVISNKNTKEEFTVKTKLIGSHNKENILGCCALARELDIKIKYIQKSVKQYKGITRRLEIRHERGSVKVIDDHACSPYKVRGSMRALIETFPEWKVTIIFEPNVGNRTEDALPLFTHVFNQADEVIIPYLKPVKTSKGQKRISGKTLADFLEKVNVNVKYIEDDDELVEYVASKSKKKHIICFMGAYSFRGMIPQMIKAV